EIIGHYNPRHAEGGEAELYINPDRALHWLSSGAQPSETARSLLRRAKLLHIYHDQQHGIDVEERVAQLRRPSADEV
ncbi:MAG TPA: 30S ribosomal protein S16, partial [Armatimonadetes bacterium]|nr:30S ribosomal protein S16 [Armatimonadota bacterium]